MHSGSQLAADIIFGVAATIEKKGTLFFARPFPLPFDGILQKLWTSVCRVRVREELAVPVIGSGFLGMRKELVLAKLLRSFCEAQESFGRSICSRLTVVVFPPDWEDGEWVRSAANALGILLAEDPPVLAQFDNVLPDPGRSRTVSEDQTRRLLERKARTVARDIGRLEFSSMSVTTSSSRPGDLAPDESILREVRVGIDSLQEIIDKSVPEQAEPFQEACDKFLAWVDLRATVGDPEFCGGLKRHRERLEQVAKRPEPQRENSLPE